jgi:hypothetical protein
VLAANSAQRGAIRFAFIALFLEVTLEQLVLESYAPPNGNLLIWNLS